MTRPGEKGAIRKPNGITVRIALVYPNTYRVGMANLGFHWIYKYLNERPDFSAERFFLPEPAPRGSQQQKALRSEESGRLLQDFHVIAFSLPFESDYPAVPRILSEAGIPPFASARSVADPLVIAGGVSISMNPEPLAQFLDLCFIGEVELGLDQEERNRFNLQTEDSDTSNTVPTAADDFFSVLREAVGSSSSIFADRREQLQLFRDVPSAYVPSAYDFIYAENGTIREIIPEAGFPERIKAAKRSALSSCVPASVFSTEEAEFGRNVLVEVNRGCRRRCRFCVAGWIHHPVRYVPYERFHHDVQRAVEEQNAVGLIGSDLANHPHLEEILTEIMNQGGTFSLSSIRPEGLSPRIIEFLAQTGQKTATLAPEAASVRMKRVIGKRIPSDRFYELTAQLVAAGIPNVRFYFMIGLPSETEEDVLEMVEFARHVRKVFVDASRPRRTIGRLGFQINPFVPKPWTPFQWAPMLPERDLQKRLKIIREGLKHERNVVVRAESVRYALVQGVLSRGDRRLAHTLSESEKPGRFSKEMIFSIQNERSKDEIFPWDITDHGIEKSILWKIYRAAHSCR